ncbi:uncharacterized protein LOC106129285 isoform X2 [Amyelois transitella]|uniref:uncharacterized protein LOC106129285 isoform X2 n=1 Tax=Amyelois transitella TaxID=680683 RepID=UPI00298FF76A|nr:uncharacterized protein LOC106129285 isoform X2 [Amyelois transitella]
MRNRRDGMCICMYNFLSTYISAIIQVKAESVYYIINNGRRIKITGNNHPENDFKGNIESFKNKLKLHVTMSMREIDMKFHGKDVKFHQRNRIKSTLKNHAKKRHDDDRNTTKSMYFDVKTNVIRVKHTKAGFYKRFRRVKPSRKPLVLRRAFRPETEPRAFTTANNETGNKRHSTGRVCARTPYWNYMSFNNYCEMDYINCMERWTVWHIIHMGPCFKHDKYSDYNWYSYAPAHFLYQDLAEPAIV